MKPRQSCKIQLLRAIVFGLILVVYLPCVHAHNDTIYYGTQVKLDIASPALEPLIYKGLMQHYEVAVNVRLLKRLYPTFELGYAGGSTGQGDSIAYTGHGGFFRIGCDLNPLKKHPESPHALLVGLRLGTAVQGAHQGTPNMPQPYKTTADCWGEIVAGCQVEIAKVNNTAFYMGWMGRFKCLFTREQNSTVEKMMPVYIPGFGKRDNIGWGVNYFLGWYF